MYESGIAEWDNLMLDCPARREPPPSQVAESAQASDEVGHNLPVRLNPGGFSYTSALDGRRFIARCEHGSGPSPSL